MGYRKALAGLSIFIKKFKKEPFLFWNILSLKGSLYAFCNDQNVSLYRHDLQHFMKKFHFTGLKLEPAFCNSRGQRMNKFPIYPKYEAGDYCGYEFDPQTDFTDFLSEARKHVSEGKFSATPPRSVELKNNNFENDVKRNCKKSWKSSLFSWLKTDKKKNQGSRETSKGSTVNKPKRGCVSGPMPGLRGPGAIAGRPNKPLSGPLTNLFTPMNRVDNEIPYLCLKKVKDSTSDVQSYGPVYLVT